MISKQIYDRLAGSAVGPLVGGGSSGGFTSGFSSGFRRLVGGQPRITPCRGTENTALANVVYTMSGLEPMYKLRTGTITTKTYNVSIECFAVNMSTVLEIAAAVRATMESWHDAVVNVAALETAYSQPVDRGFRYTLTFRIVAHQ